jgi:hypothetical protein
LEAAVDNADQDEEDLELEPQGAASF